MPAATAPNPQVDVHAPSLSGARAWFAYKGLSRPRRGRWLLGVAASFARRYDMNPLVARLLGVAIALVLTPLVYLIAWALMPRDEVAAAEVIAAEAEADSES